MNTITSSPLVTIVVPTYNRLPLLKRLMESLFHQTYENIEILVVNNGCSDGTREYLNELCNYNARLRSYEFSVNTGSPMACYNKGIELAQGEYICFIYDDDTLVKDAIEFLVGKAISHNSPWVVGNCQDNRTNELTFNGPVGDGEITFDDIIFERYTGEAWALMRTSLFDGVRFDEAMYGGESSVWLQLYKKTPAKYFHRPVRVYYTQHGGNITGTNAILANIQKILYTERRYLDLFSQDFEVRGLLPGRNFRLALISVLCGQRGKSMGYLKSYVSLRRLHWVMFHLLATALPLPILRSLVMLRSKLRGVG